MVTSTLDNAIVSEPSESEIIKKDNFWIQCEGCVYKCKTEKQKKA